MGRHSDSGNGHLMPGRGASMQDVAERTTARGLDFLRRIETTVGAVNGLAGFAQDLGRPLAIAADKFWKSEFGKDRGPIDPEGKIDDALASLEEATLSKIAECKRKHQAAVEDHRLSDEDGVADCYEQALEALNFLVESVEQFREAVREHDADCSTVHLASSLEDLFSQLDS